MKKYAVILSSVIMFVSNVGFCHSFENPMRALFKGKKTSNNQ
jgi:hypothetical protein